MPEIRKLWSRPNEAILVWPGEEPLTISYNGDTFTIPPRDETAKGPEEGSIYRYWSARSAKGDLLKGTLLVKDEVVPNDAGGYDFRLEVRKMVEYLLRDRDDLFLRGFNVVATPQEVSTALELGLPLYARSQDERARLIIANEMDRRRRFEEKGQPAPPSSSEHLISWAIAHLRARGEAERPRFSTDALREALEGRYLPAATPGHPNVGTPAPPAPARPDVPEQAAGSLFEEADALGIQLSKAELQAILRGDEEQLVYIREKVRLRREARAQEPTSEGAPAPQ